MADVINVQIPDKTLNEMVRNHLQTAFLGALEGDKDKVIQSIVHHAIFGKVKEGYQDVPFIDTLIRDVLRDECRAILKEWIEKNRDKLAAQMQKKLSSNKTLFSGLVDSMLQGVLSDWSFHFDVRAHSKSG